MWYFPWGENSYAIINKLSPGNFKDNLQNIFSFVAINGKRHIAVPFSKYLARGRTWT